MAFNLKGKEEKFFSIMNNHAHLCHEAAQVMEKAFKGETEKEAALSEIDQKEKRADELVNQTMERLRATFITPMDREDIQLLIDQYNVGAPTEGAICLAEIVTKCLKHITKSISYMSSLKKNYIKVEGRALEVLRLEEEGDAVYHEEMAKLFRECTDPIEIIKWKEILNAMEDVIDGCEDLVGTFRRVVLKYA